jgi:hypothetical protein
MNGEGSKKEKENVHDMVFKLKTGGLAELAIVFKLRVEMCRSPWGGHVCTLK